MNDSLMNDSRAQTEADAAATVEDIVRRAGTSFYWAMRQALILLIFLIQLGFINILSFSDFIRKLSKEFY